MVRITQQENKKDVDLLQQLHSKSRLSPLTELWMGQYPLLEQGLARFLCCCHLPVLILNLKVHIAGSVNSLVEYILVAKMCYFFYYCEPAASAVQQREDQVSPTVSP